MHADELPDAARRGGAGVGCRFHRSDIAAHDRRHEAGVHLLPADEDDVGGLHHRVGGFDHADEPAGFDHAQRVADVTLVFVSHEIADLPQSAGKMQSDYIPKSSASVLRSRLETELREQPREFRGADGVARED